MSSIFPFAFAAISLLCIHDALGWASSDPTYGFVSVPLNSSNFHIQKPYDLQISDRYSFIDGVHRLWVYSTDKPLSRGSNTNPRSEILIREVHAHSGGPTKRSGHTYHIHRCYTDRDLTSPQKEGYSYSSGVWQFEGYGFVPNGTTGVCIMQVFGASTRNTTAMMRVYNGSLTYYRTPIIVPYIYDRWFRLNVIHNVGAKKVSIFIDGVLKLTVDDHGGASHYFKCGVYEQNDPSYYMESRWKDIKVLKKCD